VRASDPPDRAFALIGLFVATIGYSMGLDADLLRNVAAALMIALGVVLLALGRDDAHGG
jgi:sulfite exporter TauE/SafE